MNIARKLIILTIIPTRQKKVRLMKEKLKRSLVLAAAPLVLILMVTTASAPRGLGRDGREIHDSGHNPISNDSGHGCSQRLPEYLVATV
jgi:hypothetical protein